MMALLKKKLNVRSSTSVPKATYINALNDITLLKDKGYFELYNKFFKASTKLSKKIPIKDRLEQLGIISKEDITWIKKGFANIIDTDAGLSIDNFTVARSKIGFVDTLQYMEFAINQDKEKLKGYYIKLRELYKGYVDEVFKNAAIVEVLLNGLNNVISNVDILDKDGDTDDVANKYLDMDIRDLNAEDIPSNITKYSEFLLNNVIDDIGGDKLNILIKDTTGKDVTNISTIREFINILSSSAMQDYFNKKMLSLKYSQSYISNNLFITQDQGKLIEALTIHIPNVKDISLELVNNILLVKKHVKKLTEVM